MSNKINNYLNMSELMEFLDITINSATFAWLLEEFEEEKESLRCYILRRHFIYKSEGKLKDININYFKDNIGDSTIGINFSIAMRENDDNEIDAIEKDEIEQEEIEEQEWLEEPEETEEIEEATLIDIDEIIDKIRKKALYRDKIDIEKIINDIHIDEDNFYIGVKAEEIEINFDIERAIKILKEETLNYLDNLYRKAKIIPTEQEIETVVRDILRGRSDQIVRMSTYIVPEVERKIELLYELIEALKKRQ